MLVCCPIHRPGNSPASHGQVPGTRGTSCCCILTPMWKLKLLLPVVCSSLALAQPTEKLQTMLQRIFGSSEFTAAGGTGRRGGGSSGGRWSDDGKSYDTIEGGEIVRYDVAPNSRDVLVPASRSEEHTSE